MEQRVIKWILRILLFLLVLSSLYIILKLKPFWFPVIDVLGLIFVPLILSFFLAYLLHPIVSFFVKRGVNRVLSILFVYLLLITFLYAAFSIGYPMVISQMKSLNASFPKLYQTYDQLMENLVFKNPGIPSELHERMNVIPVYFEETMARTLRNVLTVVSTTVKHLFEFLLVPFLTFYMLKDYKQVSNKLILWAPEQYQGLTYKYIGELDDSIGDYIRGQVFVSIIVGILSTIVLWIIGVDYSIIFGTIIGITNIIPYFGPFLGTIPVIIFALTVSVKFSLLVAAVILIIQFIEGNLLSPIIVGKIVSMHPVTIIILLLAGGKLAGIFGMILAIPFFSFAKISYKYIRDLIKIQRVKESS